MRTGRIPVLSGVQQGKATTLRKYVALLALIAYFTLLSFIVYMAYNSANREEFDRTMQLFTTTAGILGGVVGAIVGFYFREEKYS
ncbi:hypothetical protein GCM10023189_51020 [Nibrella saemangeumensis]|uniref:Uncharacterized protein n=1 Tax=Nibrella saemangeumensis TaxID=1084526 RepID=A0ABP8NKZ9_9BACT